MSSAKHTLNVLGSAAASSASAWYGTDARHRQRKPQPEKPITLYDIENCPYCRLVRMALCELNLDVNIRPCPEGGTIWRKEAERRGGKQLYPLLVDSNTKTVMYESADIVAYLFNTYLGNVPSRWSPKAIRMLLKGSMATSMLRGRKGLVVKPNRQPGTPLTLYSFESSPFARPVRERLSELEIPYKLINLGKERLLDYGPADRSWLLGKEYAPRKDGKRDRMQQAHGHIASPYLIDPNQAIEMAESEAIMAYLDKTYGA